MIHENGLDYVDRLHFLMGTRKVSPWARSLGISQSTMSRVLDRDSTGRPGWDFLSSLARVEKANISWLINGEGSPYQFTLTLDPTDLEKAFDRLVGVDANVFVFGHPERMMRIILLSRPNTSVQLEGDKSVLFDDYTALIVPRFTESSSDLLATHNPTYGAIPKDQLIAVGTGFRGGQNLVADLTNLSGDMERLGISMLPVQATDRVRESDLDELSRRDRDLIKATISHMVKSYSK